MTTYTVTTSVDNGAASLRQVIADTNANASANAGSVISHASLRASNARSETHVRSAAPVRNLATYTSDARPLVRVGLAYGK
jgi:hypothetical protein